MTPEQSLEIATNYLKDGKDTMARTYAMVGILQALTQMEVCGHGTRGFCKDCFWQEFQQRLPISVRNQEGFKY